MTYDMEWITDTDPLQCGYYLAAWDDEGHWRTSELWYDPSSKGSRWWPSRGYMARFVGDIATNTPGRSLTVGGWMLMPEFPGPGKILAYMVNGQVFDPKDVKIIREGVSL